MNLKYNTGMKISQNIKLGIKNRKFKLRFSHKHNSHERQGHWLQYTAQPVNREKREGKKKKRMRSLQCSMATNSLCKVQSAKRRYRPNRMTEKVGDEKQPRLQLHLLNQYTQGSVQRVYLNFLQLLEWMMISVRVKTKKIEFIECKTKQWAERGESVTNRSRQNCRVSGKSSLILCYVWSFYITHIIHLCREILISTALIEAWLIMFICLVFFCILCSLLKWTRKRQKWWLRKQRDCTPVTKQ